MKSELNSMMSLLSQRESTRQLLLITVIMIVFLGAINGQTIMGYDYGTSNASFNTAGQTNTGFFPNTPTNGGTYSVMMSNAGAGGFYLENPGLLNFGSGSELRITAPSTSGAGGLNKYSVVGFPLGQQNSYFKTQLRLGSSTGGTASSGVFYFMYGNGTSFSTNSPWATNDTFLGLRFELGANGSVATRYLVNGTWTPFASEPFSQGRNYVLEFRLNNGPGASSVAYSLNGIPQNVDKYKVDIFVDGIRIGDDLPSAGMNQNKVINSYMFYGESSVGNVANLFLDGGTYTNDVAYVAYPNYYSKSTGALNLLGTWGGVADGSGTSPGNFSLAGQGFYIHNNPAPTLTADWTVSGGGTLVSLGNGIVPTTFTIPGNYAYYGSLDVLNLGTLNIQNINTYPTYGVLYPGSTVRFSALGDQNVLGYDYYNLSIQGTGTKTLLSDTVADNYVEVGDGNSAVTLTVPQSIAITGTVNVNNAGTLNLLNSSYTSLGSLALGSTVRYAALGNQTVFPAAFSSLHIDGSGSKSLAGTASVANNLLLNAGELALSNYNITLNGPASGAGYINYNGSGRASGSGIGSLTNFRISQPASATIGMPPTIGNLDINSNGTVTMGATTSVNSLFLNSPLNLGANTMTVNGAISGAASLTGGSSSNLVMAGNTASTAIPAVDLNNLTINRPAGISLGGSVSVNGTLALSSGALSIGSNTLTLNGTVSGASGLTGGTSSNLIIGGTAGALNLPAVSSLANLSVYRHATISLSSTLTINNDLNLSSGSSIASTATNTLTFASGASGSGTGTVTGHVRQNPTSVVNGVPYSNRYMWLSVASGAGNVEAFSALKTDLSNSINSRNSIARSWTMSGLASESGTVTLSWPVSADNGNSFGFGTVWRYDGSSWIPLATKTVSTASDVRSISFDYNFGTGTQALFTVTQAQPGIITSVNSMASFGQVKINTLSAAQTYTVSASELNDGLQVNASAGYQISLSMDSGYGSSLILNHVDGIIGLTDLYVRFAPVALGSLSGSISHSSTGAGTVNVSVSGTGIDNPVIANPIVNNVLANGAVVGAEVTNLNYGDIITRGAYYSLNDGFAIEDGTLVSATGVFGTGTFTVDLSGLNRNTTYYFKAFAANAAGVAFTQQASFRTLVGYNYRSIASGNWSSASVWEYSLNDVDWFAASQAPDYQDLSINIRNGHNITVSSNLSVDELTVETGGAVIVNSGIELNITNGLGLDFTLEGDLTNSGSITFEDSAQMEAGSDSHIMFTGNSVQSIAAGFAPILNDFTIDNSNSGSPDLEVNIPLTVNGSLTMTQGSLDLNSNVLTYGESAILVYNGAASQTVGPEWLAEMTINISNINGSAGGLILNELKTFNVGTLTNSGVLNVGTFSISGSGTVLNNQRIISESSVPVNTATFSQATGSFIQYSSDVTIPAGFTYQNLQLTASSTTFALAGDITVNETFSTVSGASLNLSNHRMIFPFKYVSVGGSATVSAFNPETYVEQPGFGGVARKWSVSGASNTSPIIYLHWDNAQGEGVNFDNGTSIKRFLGGSWQELATAGQPIADGSSRMMVSFSGSLGAKADLEGQYAVGGIDDTLPVELSSFTAQISLFNTVQLQWITQSETNVSGFRIYRSPNEALDTAAQLNVFIPASNTSQAQTYVYSDNEIQEAGLYYYWLENVDLDGGNAFHGPVTVNFEMPGTGSPNVPVVSGINSIYPNPFNPETTIRFGIATDSFIRIEIFNTKGQLMRNLLQQQLFKGNHTISWDGRDELGRSCSSGTYVLRMCTGRDSYTRKLMLLK